MNVFMTLITFKYQKMPLISQFTLSKSSNLLEEVHRAALIADSITLSGVTWGSPHAVT